MQERRLGKTEHMSTVAIFGAAALARATQDQADRALERIIATGVNHIDVAPSYGAAEERLGPWLASDRNRFFVGCKTTARTREGATEELHRSLERLRLSSFDLYQLHAVNTLEDLDRAMGPDGALEAIVEACDAGLTRFVGITSHGMSAPAVLQQALHRYDFDTVLFPVNFVLFADTEYRQQALALLRECRDHDVGVMAIKSISRRPWASRARRYTTWYEPIDDPAEMQRAVNLALSQEVTGLCSAGDLTLLPHFLDACEYFTPMSLPQQEALIAAAGEYEPIFSGTRMA